MKGFDSGSYLLIPDLPFQWEETEVYPCESANLLASAATLQTTLATLTTRQKQLSGPTFRGSESSFLKKVATSSYVCPRAPYGRLIVLASRTTAGSWTSTTLS
jgi:hypothetical protein